MRRMVVGILLGVALGGTAKWLVPAPTNDNGALGQQSSGTGKKLSGIPSGTKTAAQPTPTSVTLEELLRAPDDSDWLSQLAIFLPGAELEDLALLAEKKLARDPLSDVARQLIFMRWAELDAPDLLAWARQQDDLKRAKDHGWMVSNGYLVEAYDAWAHLDPQAAFAAARAQPRAFGLSRILKTIGRSDPALAVSLANETNVYLGWSETMSFASLSDEELVNLAAQATNHRIGLGIPKALVTEWVKRDPDAAFAWAKSLGSHKQRTPLLVATLAMIAETDPNKATELLGSLPPSRARGQSVLAIAEKLAASSPEKALAFARSFPAGAERQAALSEVVKAVQTNWDPQRAAALLAEMNWYFPDRLSVSTRFDIGGGSGSHVYRIADPVGRILEQLAETVPEIAAGFALKITPDKSRDKILGRVFEQWSGEDPAAAFKWLSVQSRIGNASEALTPALRQWFEKDPAKVMAWLADTDSSSPLYQTSSATIAAEMAKSQPLEALAWAKNLELPSAARLASWKQWIESDPLTAAENAVRLGFYQDESLQRESRKLFKNLTIQDPAQAIEFLDTIPEDRARDHLFAWYDVAYYFGKNDITATSAWLQSMEPGFQQDSAIRGMLNQLGNSDTENFETAFLWADAVSDESTRESSLRNTANRWFRADPAAARAAVQSAEISETLRDELLGKMEEQSQ